MSEKNGAWASNLRYIVILLKTCCDIVNFFVKFILNGICWKYSFVCFYFCWNNCYRIFINALVTNECKMLFLTWGTFQFNNLPLLKTADDYLTIQDPINQSKLEEDACIITGFYFVYTSFEVRRMIRAPTSWKGELNGGS